MKKASQEIIEKIQKLLALANSSNEHEAKLAAERASTLLTKYNLSMQDVETSEREYESVHFISKNARMGMEQKYLFGIIQTFFFVTVVTGKRRNEFTGQKVTVWSFFGQKHNVEIAKYVYAFLDITFHKLFDEYIKNGGQTGKTSRNSFYMGLARGIATKLEETRVKVEQEVGLVIVKDPGISDFIEETVGKTRNVPQRATVVDREAYGNGVEKGKNINIARGLGGESKAQIGTALKINGSN